MRNHAAKENGVASAAGSFAGSTAERVLAGFTGQNLLIKRPKGTRVAVISGAI
jgi:hypothetical protein